MSNKKITKFSYEEISKRRSVKVIWDDEQLQTPREDVAYFSSYEECLFYYYEDLKRRNLFDCLFDLFRFSNKIDKENFSKIDSWKRFFRSGIILDDFDYFLVQYSKGNKNGFQFLKDMSKKYDLELAMPFSEFKRRIS